MSTAPTHRRAPTGCMRASASQLSWSIVFAISLGLGAVALHRLTLPLPIRFLVAGAPLIAGFFYIRAVIRDMHRQMDELQLRIYLEASAVIVCGLFIGMLVYPLFESAGIVGRLDYHVVLALVILLGAAGYLNARR